MIPEIGIIIGIYAVVRLIEILASAESRFHSSSASGVVKMFAGVCLVPIAFLTLDLVMGGLSGKSPVGTPQVQMPSLFTPPTSQFSPEENRPRREASEAQRREIEEMIRQREATKWR